MARSLRELGHEVTILTTSAFGTLPDDDPWVVRSGDLQSLDRLRRLLRRPPVRAGERPAAPMPPPPWYLVDVIVPDTYLASWVPFAVRAMRRLVRERAIDCVITNGPPHSTHLLGLALGRRRPAWIVDLEDGWRFESLRDGWPTAVQDRLDAALERRVLNAADAVAGISEPMAADAVQRFGKVAAAIPNGWDPELERAVADATPIAREPGEFWLVHTGSLTHGPRRDPTPLFAALDRLLATDADAAARLRLVLAGRLTAPEAAALAALPPHVRAAVRHVGELPRADAIRLQRDADALLLLASHHHRSLVTGKAFEYLAAGRPIVALAADNEAARLIEDTGTGALAPPEDPDAIARLLRRALDGELAAAYAPRGLDRYRFPAPAREMAELVEAALARRSSARA
jgi:glycosyltransferase involved in cell wall biosynthesis